MEDGGRYFQSTSYLSTPLYYDRNITKYPRKYSGIHNHGHDIINLSGLPDYIYRCGASLSLSIMGY